MSVPVENQLKTAYKYDEKGYFSRVTHWQYIDGEFLQSPSSTDVCPFVGEAPDPKFFYRFVNGQWLTERKPTCAADLIGVVVSHTSMTEHDIEMRELVKKFAQEEGYREKRGADLSWSVEKIPEKTPEEKRTEAEALARAKRDALLTETDKYYRSDWQQKLTPDQRIEIDTYSEALRQVPQQSGFPYSVEWPVKPSWVK